MKGGVGRSTALGILALRLAQHEKLVLVADFDLESPGLSSLLLPQERLPSYGIVDWLVEDRVGQADAGLLSQLTAQSPLADGQPGKIIVLPAFGAGESHYIEKLARVYPPVERGGVGVEEFTDRVARLLKRVEENFRVNCTLLDSRAGLHDIAATTVTRLQAGALLFAINSPQTWQAYGLLFRHWQRSPEITAGFRENLKIVDALVPETERSRHRETMIDSAHQLFADTIYEESTGEDFEAFNFGPQRHRCTPLSTTNQLESAFPTV